MSNDKSITASSSPSSSAPSSPVPMTLDRGGCTAAATLFTVHPDIIQTHILTRLDGPTLAAVACVSSQLHRLSAEENIWREICSATWPSVNHPSVRCVISTFPSGHRSLFSDSFPLLDHQPLKKQKAANFPTLAADLISAVDIYYQDNLIYSKVKELETATGWFLYSPLRIDLLDQKESVPTPIQCTGQEETWLKHLEDSLTLSWIVIDPTQNRAGNMSSQRPVVVERHRLTREVQVRYSVILWGRRELVECRVLVTCGVEEGGEMQVREVSMQMVDMEGKGLNGAESLQILRGAIEGRRRREMKGNEGKEKYEDFVERKRERKERKQREERAMDLVCIAIGIIGLVAFWWTLLGRSYS